MTERLDVRAHGAVGDGATDDTAAIQRAVDAAAGREATVVLADGTFLARTIHLRSRMSFEISAGTTLLAAADNRGFDPQEVLPFETHSDVETSDFAHAFLSGRDLERVAVVGGGTIDANRTVRWGPKPIAFKSCREVTVRDVTIVHSPNYCVSLGGCDGVLVERVTIREALSDGIDPDCCRRVRIVDCDVFSDDDAVCIKSSLIFGRARACEDIEVTGCRLRSGANGFKIGTETSGPVRNVRVADCEIDGRRREGRDEDQARLLDVDEGGGIAIETVDGADVTSIRVERVRIAHCYAPIFVRRGARGRGQAVPRPGVLRSVVLRDIDAIDAFGTSSITGLPGTLAEDVALERIRIESRGGGNVCDGEVPEAPDQYPQCTMFGTLPAWGLYARHVSGLVLREVALSRQLDDERAAFLTDDVVNASVEGLVHP